MPGTFTTEMEGPEAVQKLNDLYDAVGAVTALGLATNNDSTKGSALVGYWPGSAGSTGRTLQSKVRELPVSITDKSATTGGTAAANLTAINVAISEAVTGGVKSLQVPAGDFLVTTKPTNPMGVEFVGDGRVLKPITGGNRQLNTYANRFKTIVGRAYLSSFHWKLLAPISTTILFSGDSTTEGVSVTSPYRIWELIPELARRRGLQNVSAVNAGHSGMTTIEWLSTYLAADLATNPDVYVPRWGINDPGTLTAAQFIANIRTGLATIRAAKTVNELSVVLMMPNSTSDTPNNRDERWYESIHQGLMDAAIDYQCCFADTYGYLPNSRGANDWMDSPYPENAGAFVVGQEYEILSVGTTDFTAIGASSNSVGRLFVATGVGTGTGTATPDRHIHPRNVGNVWIATLVADALFPEGLRVVSANAFLNLGSSDVGGIKAVADAISTYPRGMTQHRATPTGDGTTGWLYDGIVITFNHVDGVQWQINVPYITDSQNYAWRLGQSGVWKTWTNTADFLRSGGSLGVPSSGDATNLTGTASGLTAGHVTTNANLTGPITSVGNATSVASQTGTGSKFVMDTDPTLAGTPLAPTAAAATNTTQIATTAFVQAAVSAAVSGLLNFKGTTDCSATPNYPAASKGDAYIVSVAGKIGGASGTSVDVGDWYVATANSAGGTEASVGASWGHMEHNLVGALLASNNLSDLANATTARSNLGIPNVTNDAQTKAAVVPNTVPAAGNVLVGNAGGTAYASVGISGDVTLSSAGAVTVTKVNGVSLAGLATGILKNTTTTGAPSIAVAGDFPTFNQDTTGSAAKLAISGQTGVLSFTGLVSTNRIKTVRDAADTILELGGSYSPTGTWTGLIMAAPQLGTPASGSLGSCTNIPVANATGTLPVANGGTNYTGATLTTFSSTITASSGTFTTVSAVLHYLDIGKVRIWSVEITDTTNGSAAGAVIATTPSGTAKSDCSPGWGIGKAVSGKAIKAQMTAGASTMSITNYDNTYPGATGEKLCMGGWYELT